MNLISQSSLREYAERFWIRQCDKKVPCERIYCSSLREGVGDPLMMLRHKYKYKLPYNGENECEVQIMQLSRNEIEALTIHDEMLHGEWMLSSGLNPVDNNLRYLAAHFIERGYFTRPHESGQWKNYEKWRNQGSLKNVMESDEPLIQLKSPKDYEIVDGWGRMLPYVALLQEGFEFHPVACFVASKSAA